MSEEMEEMEETVDFEVLNRFTGDVQFTAKISERFKFSSEGDKLGAAVEWAIANKVSLSEASLKEANLRGVDLSCDRLNPNSWKANIIGLDLRWADLSYADLRGANLKRVNFWEANLHAADLRKSSLEMSSLRKANLSFADMRWANLSNISLDHTNFYGARLEGTKIVIIHTSRWVCYVLEDKIYVAGESYPIQAVLGDEPLGQWNYEWRPDPTWWNDWRPVIRQAHENLVSDR